MLWLTKYFTKRRIEKLFRQQKGWPPGKPNRQYTEDLVKELNAEFFRDYNPAMGKSRASTFLYANVDTYTKKLRELTLLVKSERPIPPDWSEGVKESYTSVDWFLTSKDGYYINAAAEVHKFGQAAYDLCRALAPSDTVDHGVYEHNFRMLTKLFINLRAVMEDMLKVSITKV